MKTILLASLFLWSLASGGQVTVEWSNFPNGVSVATDSNDNVYTAYWDYNPAGDITVTKRSSQGAILWQNGFDNTDNTRHEVATWVQTDSQDNVIVSGTIRSGFSNPVNAASVVMKFNSAGDLLWRLVYESNFDGSSTKQCLVDAQDNIYVLGLGIGPNGMVTKVKKIAPDGTPVWNFFDTAGIGAPLRFKFTPDNGIIIVGRSVTGIMNGFAKIDLNGNLLWAQAGITSPTVGDATVDASGNIYMVNGEPVVQNGGSIMTKLDPAGNLIWAQTQTMIGYFIETGSDQQPVIAGFPSPGQVGAAFLKRNESGQLLWFNSDADGPGVGLLSHAQLKLDPLNAAYLVAGNLFSMGVCKVNADGTNGWIALVGSGYGQCIDFGSDYSVYVAGGTTAKLSQTVVIPSGCTDPGACNFDAAAIVDDGSCEYTSCVQGCPGDFDSNGAVAYSDLTLLIGQFGCASGCTADMDGDGSVTFSDLVLFQGLFGVLCP